MKGGPLQLIVQSSNEDTNSTESSNKMAVVGVTSFGSGDMSVFGYVTFCNGNAAYTKIPYFNNFLTQRIGEDNLCMI